MDLAVERRLDGGVLEKAERVIREMYKKDGRALRVEHAVTQVSPGSSVALVFQVIELCKCE